MIREVRQMFGRAFVVAAMAVAAVWCTGCAETVSREELLRVQNQSWMESQNAWWYVGSKGGYHYFYNETDYFPKYVKTSDLQVKFTFPKTDDREKWVRVPLGKFREDDAKLVPDFFPQEHHLGEQYRID